MNKNKIISALMSGVMALSALGGLSASADEEKLYTYKELSAMSKEEFFELEGAETDYNCIKQMSARYGGLVFRFVENVYDGKYKVNDTENSIKELLGDEISYKINSPVVGNDDNYLQCNILLVYDEDFDYTINEATDNEYLYLGKILYCLNQVSDNITYHTPDMLWLTNIVRGDANNDGVLNIRDAAFIIKHLAKGQKDKLPKCSDFNGDGEVTVRDAAKIAQYLASQRFNSKYMLGYVPD